MLVLVLVLVRGPDPAGAYHEKLDVYRKAIEFLSWVGELLDGPLVGVRSATIEHLDESSQSIANNIAEGTASDPLPTAAATSTPLAAPRWNAQPVWMGSSREPSENPSEHRLLRHRAHARARPGSWSSERRASTPIKAQRHGCGGGGGVS